MHYVTDAEGVKKAARSLARAALVGADTEAAGYHRYHDRVCVLQLSSREETFVVDTLAVRDLEPLAKLFSGTGTEIVFHDADYDLRLLDRDFGFEVRGLFDTKIAAQFLGEPAFGLGSLAEKYLGVTMAKKYQRADWAQRPLPPEMIEYAAEDTRHLPALRDRLGEALAQVGRLHWAEEEFRLIEQTRWSGEAEEADAFLKVKGARDLGPRELAVLREAWRWREEAARERDVASFRVASNETLIALARRAPTSAGELAEVKGLSRSMSERRGGALLSGIRRALRVTERELPRFPRGPRRPPPAPEFDAAVERLRKARDGSAVALELDRGFLMPRNQLEEVARAEPRSLDALRALPGVRAWQVEALGPALLRAVQGRED